MLAQFHSFFIIGNSDFFKMTTVKETFLMKKTLDESCHHAAKQTFEFFFHSL